jgi:hypothetical protein
MNKCNCPVCGKELIRLEPFETDVCDFWCDCCNVDIVITKNNEEVNSSCRIVGKFYMKSGAIIEEELAFDCDKESAEKYINNLKNKVIKTGFREDYNFQFTFGSTMFRGKDISAVTLTVM